jgi:hypothetical protein
MKTKRNIWLTVIGWIALTVLSITWGVQVDWSDNVHVNYGVPLVWATHTLYTIAGAVDIWSFDYTALAINLLLWLGLMIVLVLVMLVSFKNKRIYEE